MYDPCYSTNLGLVGFRCRVGQCTKVVRTYRGIVMHCLRVHGLRAQIALPGMENLYEKSKQASSGELQPVRANSGDDSTLDLFAAASTEDK